MPSFNYYSHEEQIESIDANERHGKSKDGATEPGPADYSAASSWGSVDTLTVLTFHTNAQGEAHYVAF